jgi:hypothetical protein
MINDKKMNSIGEMRKNWLNQAGYYYTNAREDHDFLCAVRSMDSFEFTLEPGSVAKKELLTKKEQIENDKNENIRKWNVWKETLGYWEQGDAQQQRHTIEVAAIGERLEACWDISKRHGLFND